MAVQNPPVWMQDGVYSAEHDRLVTGLLVDRNMTKEGTLRGVSGGVVPPDDQLKVVATDSMTVTVRGGVAVVPRPVSSSPGAYICYNQGDESLAILPEPSTGNRHDIVVARVNDKMAGATVPASSWELAVVKGSPAATPIDPPVAANEIPLARVLVYSPTGNMATSANKVGQAQITDLRQFVSGLGGVHTKWSNPMPPHSAGRMVWDAPSSKLSISDGIGWDDVITRKALAEHNAKNRPQQAHLGGQHFFVWFEARNTLVHSVYTVGDLKPVPAPEVVVTTPSGIIEVSMFAFGQMVPTAHPPVNGGILYTGWAAFHNGAVVGRHHGHTGPAFSSTEWTASGSTVLGQGLPANVPLTIKLGFLIDNADEYKAKITNCMLVVKPVL